MLHKISQLDVDGRCDDARGLCMMPKREWGKAETTLETQGSAVDHTRQGRERGQRKESRKGELCARDQAHYMSAQFSFSYSEESMQCGRGGIWSDPSEIETKKKVESRGSGCLFLSKIQDMHEW